MSTDAAERAAVRDAKFLAQAAAPARAEAASAAAAAAGAGAGAAAPDEALYPQYDAAHPLGVPLLVNVLAFVAQTGFTIDAAPAFASGKAVWLRDAQLQWALAGQERSKDKRTRLMRACAEGDLARAVELLDGWRSNVDAQDAAGLAPLHFACKFGHIEVARQLVARGAKLETKNKNGNTALNLASLSGHTAIIRLLLDAGAQLETKANMGATPLYSACQSGCLEAVRLLLESGAAVNARTSTGASSLMMASDKGHAPLVRELIARGADVNAETRLGGTALMAACGNGHVAAAMVLVDAGANMALRNNGGHTAMSYARSRAARDFAEPGEGEAPSTDAERAEHRDLVVFLQARGAP
jgi:ankyrin repeat protein